MGFREYITNRWYRRWAEARTERLASIKPPANPSRRYVDKLVSRLLYLDTAQAARKELSMIGAAAVPSLAAALGDPRYHQAEWPKVSAREAPLEAFRAVMVPAPLKAVLQLLVPHGPERVLAAAMPLVASPSMRVRETAALTLASLGRVETMAALAKLLQDADDHVRTSVRFGIDTALNSGRTDAEFRRQAYD